MAGEAKFVGRIVVAVDGGDLSGGEEHRPVAEFGFAGCPRREQRFPATPAGYEIKRIVRLAVKPEYLPAKLLWAQTILRYSLVLQERVRKVGLGLFGQTVSRLAVYVRSQL